MLGIVVFRTPVTSLSVVGILFTCVGIVWYAMANYRAKQVAKEVVATGAEAAAAAKA